MAACFFGDGTVEEGIFHETLNFAVVKKVPVLFVCENNGYSTHTRLDVRQPSSVTIRARAASYGLPAQAVEIEGDRARLKRMLGNLVANAAKYTVPGGEVAIDLHREGDDAVIQVRDNGIGMPKEMLDRICEALASTATIDDGLLGVGLTLARRVVQAHGGAIGCHSDGVGQGTRFVLRLPLRPAP